MWFLKSSSHHRATPSPGHSSYLTSTSHSAFELVAEVADCLPVVLRKTCCFFLCSSQVRNFSCSAWNNLTTSPCQSPECMISRDRDITHQRTSYKQVNFWVSPLWGCHLYYHSISWKGLFSSLYCNSQSWPKRRNKIVSPTVLCLHKLCHRTTALFFF